MTDYYILCNLPFILAGKTVLHHDQGRPQGRLHGVRAGGEWASPSLAVLTLVVISKVNKLLLQFFNFFYPIPELSARFRGAAFGPAVAARVHHHEGRGDPVGQRARRHPSRQAQEPARQQQGVARRLERRVRGYSKNHIVHDLYLYLLLNHIITICNFYRDRNWKAIPQHLRQSLGLTFEDDGEFYMSFR